MNHVMQKQKLKILQDQFTIHRLPAGSEIPVEIYQSPFYTIVNTDEELSVVCSSSIDLKAEKSDEGWSCIKVAGPLNLSMTGIIAGISDVLAKSQIGIFTISTYDTDYVLVRTTELSRARQALTGSGYIIEI